MSILEIYENTLAEIKRLERTINLDESGHNYLAFLYREKLKLVRRIQEDKESVA
jgi:hypothetical protein